METEGADREGDGAEGAERCEPHDDGDDTEHGVGALLDHAGKRRARPPHARQREPEDHREEQDLENLPLGKRTDDGGRDDAEQDVDDAVRFLGRGGVAFNGSGVKSRGVGVDTGTRFNNIDGNEPDDERQRRHHLKIEERLHADPPDFFEVVHARDAGDYGAEDDRRNDHLDELDEPVTKRFQAGAEIGPEMADRHAESDGHQHLDVERAH